LINENQGRYTEALNYYYDAIKMYGEAGNKWAMIDRYFNIGFLYEDQNNYPEALKNHREALRLSEELGTKEGIAASNSNMGECIACRRIIRKP
jgi:tetratricopeptide (TPR) repeat protein